MKTVTIEIKKSVSGNLWSDVFVGEKVKAVFNKEGVNYLGVYTVLISENENLKSISNRIISGYIEPCDCKLIN